MNHAARGKRVEKICKNCGKPFMALLIKIKEGGGIFCSRECHQEYRKKHKRDKKELNRLYQKKNKYGLTEETYKNMFVIQENKCAICGTSFNEKKPVVDHNHETKKVRGLLCGHCNTLLGMAHDDINILKNAIIYLENNNV